MQSRRRHPLFPQYHVDTSQEQFDLSTRKLAGQFSQKTPVKSENLGYIRD